MGINQLQLVRFVRFFHVLLGKKLCLVGVVDQLFPPPQYLVDSDGKRPLIF